MPVSFSAGGSDTHCQNLLKEFQQVWHFLAQYGQHAQKPVSKYLAFSDDYAQKRA